MSDFKPKTKNQLRCVCTHKPLLAMYGLNQDDEIYVHVLIKKQSRIFGEILFETIGGTAKMRCRNCLRWTRVKLVGRKPDVEPSVESAVLPDDPFPVDATTP